MNCWRVRALWHGRLAMHPLSRDAPICLRRTSRSLTTTIRVKTQQQGGPLPNFVPATQLDNIDHLKIYTDQPPAKPTTQTFYTGRADFYEMLYGLEDRCKFAASLLRNANLFPYPGDQKKNLPPWKVAWKSASEMESVVGTSLTASTRRKLLVVLKEMHDLRKIALAGKVPDAFELLNASMSIFERPPNVAQRKVAKDTRDEHLRSYAVGRRKESSARVWVIPTFRRVDHQPVFHLNEETGEEEEEEDIERTSGILVNNIPLATYFKNTIDRTRVVRPLKVAQSFGQFNVFALVRGGGLTGQAGAIAHGIAKNLIMHRPALEPILLKSKILLRDPRMVERKKTGQPKARKKYAWVRR